MWTRCRRQDGSGQNLAKSFQSTVSSVSRVSHLPQSTDFIHPWLSVLERRANTSHAVSVAYSLVSFSPAHTSGTPSMATVAGDCVSARAQKSINDVIARHQLWTTMYPMESVSLEALLTKPSSTFIRGQPKYAFKMGVPENQRICLTIVRGRLLDCFNDHQLQCCKRPPPAVLYLRPDLKWKTHCLKMISTGMLLLKTHTQ